jgi:Flp pilus assembly protein TadD
VDGTQRVDTLLELALIAKQKGQLAEAEAQAREAVELGPENCQAHWVLAWTLVALERERKLLRSSALS